MMAGGEGLGVLVARLAVIYGFGLWAWGWFRARSPLLRQRYHDCGTSIVIASTLALYFLRDRELNILDWLIVTLGPVFIAVALWRLFRTQPFIQS